MPIFFIYFNSFLLRNNRILYILLFPVWVIIFRISKGRIEYGGADLQHFYLPNFKCAIPGYQYDIVYRYLSSIINFVSECDHNIGFVLEAAIIVILLMYLLVSVLKRIKSRSSIKYFMVLSIISLLLVKYLITGTRQYISEVLILIFTTHMAFGRKKVIPRGWIFGLFAAGTHTTGLLNLFSFSAIYQLREYSLRKIFFICMLIFFLTIFVMLFYSQLDFRAVQNNFYFQKFQTYTAINRQELEPFNLLNMVKFCVTFIFSFHCMRVAHRVNDTPLLTVSLNCFIWVVLIFIFVVFDFIGYVTAARLISTPFLSLLFFSVLSTHKYISIVGFLLFNVFSIKGLMDYMSYLSNSVEWWIPLFLPY